MKKNNAIEAALTRNLLAGYLNTFIDLKTGEQKISDNQQVNNFNKIQIKILKNAISYYHKKNLYYSNNETLKTPIGEEIAEFYKNDSTFSDKHPFLKWKTIGKIGFGILLIIFLYLFALNGRYQHISGGHVLDKWTQTIKQADVK